MQENLGVQKSNIYSLVLTGIMAGLVLAATSFFRIPVAATNGYVHLGDAMIFLSVMLLGTKKGAFAGATGSALADLLGGYGHWVPWTFVIKGIMALVAGMILFAGKSDSDSDAQSAAGSERPFSIKSVLAMTAGSLVMMAGYFTAQRIIYGTWAAPLAALPGNIVQGAAGVILAEVFSSALRKAAPQLFYARS